MNRFGRKGIAPVVAALLILVVSVVAIILLYISPPDFSQVAFRAT